MDEVLRIESQTPFIKEGSLINKGKHILLISTGNTYSRLALSDIEFVKTGNYELGKGSYGKVQLAKHKKTG
jgi:hypothetical protein